ncbi:sunset domain-containing protein [Actinokineospora xionganensis]|uniref:Uncharacterized protein n=1 Tax=Actinokineospora xionganensis TaxID=2684470 RepID=A0ABR7L1M7_9PSEU|nr:hypothetical protein [Actinokineospora xionganensis]MBC6446423.1 hypothetical protein [Actinokineospora xionganensis]
MKYLFGQVWLWLLLSFLLGALFTWLVQRFFRKPKVEVTEERIGGPAVKDSDRSPKRAASTDKASASARPRASALGSLDDDERTGTLRADDTPGDDTPTGRIPVQTLDDTGRSGTLKGSLDDEPKSDPAAMLGAAGLATAGGAAVGKMEDKDEDSAKETATAATTAKHHLVEEDDSSKTEWMAAPPPSMEEGNRDTLPAMSDEEAVSDLNVSGSATSGAAAGAAAGMAARRAGTTDKNGSPTDEDSGPGTLAGSGPIAGAAATGVATGSGADGLAGTGPVADPESDKGSGNGSDQSSDTGLGSHVVGSTGSGADRGLPVEPESDTDADAGKGGTPMFATSTAVAEAPAIEEPYGPGSARPGPGGASPGPEYTIKGNADSMLFHTTESPYYGRTKAEVWFKSAADAERAGFTPWSRTKREARPAVAQPTWEAGEYAGSAKPKADGTAPAEEFKVKGNVDSMLFHTEESAFYSVTKAEVWFRDAEEAEAAGFRPWNRVGGAERGQTEVPRQAVARVPEGPFGPNSANPKADGSAPSDEFTIKGNADSMLFHTTESPYYPRTRAEVWFKTASDAEQAGFTAWNKRRSEKS